MKLINEKNLMTYIGLGKLMFSVALAALTAKAVIISLQNVPVIPKILLTIIIVGVVDGGFGTSTYLFFKQKKKIYLLLATVFGVLTIGSSVWVSKTVVLASSKKPVSNKKEYVGIVNSDILFYQKELDRVNSEVDNFKPSFERVLAANISDNQTRSQLRNHFYNKSTNWASKAKSLRHLRRKLRIAYNNDKKAKKALVSKKNKLLQQKSQSPIVASVASLIEGESNTKSDWERTTKMNIRIMQYGNYAFGLLFLFLSWAERRIVNDLPLVNEVAVRSALATLFDTGIRLFNFIVALSVLLLNKTEMFLQIDLNKDGTIGATPVNSKVSAQPQPQPQHVAQQKISQPQHVAQPKPKPSATIETMNRVNFIKQNRNLIQKGKRSQVRTNLSRARKANIGWKISILEGLLKQE